MSGLRTKDFLLNGTAQACSASSNTVVSNTVPMSDHDARCIDVRVVLSAISVTNGITFKLQDSPYDGQWEDVTGSGSVSSTKKSVTTGAADVSVITVPSTAGAAQGDYVVFYNQAGTEWAAWLDINAAGTAPTGAAFTAVTAGNRIKVSIVTGGTSAQNGTIFATAIAGVTGMTVTDNGNGTVTLTQLTGGSLTAEPTPHNTGDTGAGSITVSTTTAGSNGTAVNIGTDTITLAAHGFTNGQRVIYSINAHTAIGGLTDGSTYYVSGATTNTFQLSTTNANSWAGTVIDLTSYGGGTNLFYAADYEIRLLDSDSATVGVLPLMPNARVLVNTGASDTCTVSNVFVTKRHG